MQAAVTRSRRRRERVDGVLRLDKPRGMSSNDAMLTARRLLGAEKAGHGGTLDPLASGLLPVLFGEATKFAHDLLDADKGYLATLLLGQTTPSGDAETPVDGRRAIACGDAEIRAACAAFVGDIQQVPPMHSAIKRDGRPLYEMARAGRTVERLARGVRIDSIEVVSIELPDVTLRVSCSKGTYLRTLAVDIGERLGCGAYLVALRRERVGRLGIGESVSLAALEALPDEAARRALLAPLDTLLVERRRIDLDAAQATRFLHGQRLRIAAGAADGAGEESAAGEAGKAGDDAEPIGQGEQVRVYGPERLLGVARLVAGVLSPLRLIAAHPPSPERRAERAGPTNERAAP